MSPLTGLTTPVIDGKTDALKPKLNVFSVHHSSKWKCSCVILRFENHAK